MLFGGGIAGRFYAEVEREVELKRDISAHVIDPMGWVGIRG